MLSRHSVENQTKMEHHHYPSFSSSLLGAIYHSIDQSDLPRPLPRTDSLRTFSYEDSTKGVLKCKGGGEMFRHNMYFVDKTSAAGITSETYLVMRREPTSRRFVLGNSSGSSSDSSRFSSSESEFAGSRSSSSCYSTKRPKPTRTSISAEHPCASEFRTFLQARSCKKPCVLVKIPPCDGMKARPTGKSFGYMKKVIKQPISPGRKLASFLNSIFTTKKVRIAVQSCPDHVAYSPSSSFSRPCLSMKSPPSINSSTSRRKSTEKRSVRFCPVNVILDEDCDHHCGHKSLVEGSKSRSDLGGRVAAAVASETDFDVVMEENRRVVEAAREMLRNYQKRKESYDDNLEDGEGDDDAASCASSDLFELDNFDQYREELPVYGTTSVGDNQAIADALMV